MLVTDLSDSEIVLGKLAARLLPVLGLVAGSWPVMAIGTLLGGIDPTALTLAFAVILAMALVGCTMAMALSVWARKTQEVVLATYTVLGLILLAYPVLVRDRALGGGSAASPLAAPRQPGLPGVRPLLVARHGELGGLRVVFRRFRWASRPS